MDDSTEKLLNDSMISTMSTNTDDLASSGVDNLNYVPGHPDNPYYADITKDRVVPDFLLGTYNRTEVPKVTRPLSMYEPWIGPKVHTLSTNAQHQHEADISFESELVARKNCWEAEDANDFITTLDESAILDIESFEDVNQLYAQPASKVIVAADIHHRSDMDDRKYEEIEIYATVKKKKPREKPVIQSQPVDCQEMITSGGPMEKFPDIMTTSCYGELMNTSEVWNDNASMVKSNENLLDSRAFSIGNNNSMNNSIMDGFSSMASSIYEPHSMNSSIEIVKLPSNEKARVKWWDEFTEETEAELKQIAEKDLAAIRKILENETGGALCPSCQMPFDKGKKRKLIDTCGHERCYSCMFRNEICPICNPSAEQDIDHEILSNSGGYMGRKVHDYDTGIGSTTTLLSPLGSPQPVLRSHAKQSGLFSPTYQTPSDLYKLKERPPRCPSVSGKSESYYCSINTTFGAEMKPSQRTGLNSSSEISSSACATPPQNRRRLFSPKNLRSPFGYRRSNAATDNSTLSDDEGGNVKPILLNGKSKSSQDELQVRLGFFLENNPRRNVRVPIQSCSSLTSTNTSPVSTLTGSSEADVSRALQLQEPNNYNTGCDSIGSMMSVSVSEQSNASSSPLSRRHSVTTSQNPSTNGDDLGLFKARKTTVRRSARSGQIKGPIDPKIRFAQYRQHQQLTLKPLFFEVPTQEPDPLFVGRHWLVRELANAVQSTDSPGVLLSGNLGTGKTALLLQLVEYSCFGRRKEMPIQENDGIYCQINVAHDRLRNLASHVVAYHFCQADNNSTCLIPDFIHSLAAQLCQAPQLAAYHEFLLGEQALQNVLSVKECIADPERAMIMGILEPLAALRRVGKISPKNCVILIDALCEAEYHRPDHGDTIASFLQKMTEHFPPWLKVIATIRTQMLQFTKGLAYTKMSLDNWNSNEVLQKDILEYITFRINQTSSIQHNIAGGREIVNTSLHFKFAQHLLTLTTGSFLFAKLTLDLIERGNLVIKSSSFKVLPVSLAQIFLLNFNLRFPTTTAYDKISNILSVCLAALYPLTLTEIFYSINALIVEGEGGEYIDWEEFICRFKTLTGFLIRRIDNTYMFFHPSFREWLIRRDDGESIKFLCDLRNGHAGIALRLSRLQAPLDPEQALELGHHILKAHLYRAAPQHQSPRDLQAVWVSSVTSCISSALCTLRNVYNPNIKVSRLLLLAGASPDHITSFLGNATVLCIAAHEGIVPMVSLLLEFGADVEKVNSQGCTPLILAAAKGHCDVVRQLVAAGSALGQTDTSQRCALVHAAIVGKLKVVKYLVACDWNTRSNSNDVTLEQAAQQALIAAASQGNTEIVEDFLDMGEVQVNRLDIITGETALTTACVNGHTETVSILISRGAATEVKNRKEQSPLLIAVKEGHWAIVERLLQNQTDVEQRDSNEKTALMVAAEEGHVGIIELLLNRGASLSTQDKDGLTALSWACLRGKQQAAKCLLERNADKQHADSTGRTPLDLAAYQGSTALVQMLLDHGAQIEHVDINGMRPLDRAIACRNVQVVQVFLKRGAKLGPATWAMANGKSEIMLILLNKLLEDGNTLYRKNRLQEASHRYQYALKKIPTNSTGTNGNLAEAHASTTLCSADTNNNSSSNATFQQLKFNFLLNLSRCKRKMNDVAEAIDLAAQAIEIKPNAYDGYYARSKALMEYGNFGEALKDAGTALLKSHSTSPEIRETLTRLHSDLQKRQMHALTVANNNTALQFGGSERSTGGVDPNARSSSVHGNRSIAESMDVITDL
ncbi:protein TANC2 isoform X2 [Toxorhynchites rutilus septentrionalis]|uniref:protein TANC2 isoform X2 n=1 Tax=Toxorhynchites rutilus septentrionalis TaxID=329112 RepID=UPI00247832E3|nr:protein TANC2 isoform X2 [Toxorhynchites rutilus septentrionalis]